MEAVESASPAPTRSAFVVDLALACGAGLLAALCYAALRTELSHEYDLYWMLPRLRDGDLVYPRHPLALPFAHALTEMLDGHGTLLERLRLANGLCAAVAVGVVCLAARRLGADRARALLAAAAFGLLPAAVRFATVAELHGLFLPFAAAALWCVVGLVRRPGLAAAAVTGVACGVSAAVHATGHLLVGVALAWLVSTWWGRIPAKLLVSAAAVLLMSAALVTGAVPLFVSGMDGAPLNDQLDFVAEHPWAVDGLAALLFGEYLWPLLPLSLVWPLAALRLGGRAGWAAAVTLAGSFVVYLVGCAKLFCWPTHGYLLHEFGAYLMPLGMVVAAVAATAMRPRSLAACALVAALASGFDYGQNVGYAPDRAFGAAAHRYLEGHDVRLLAGDRAEFEGLYERLYEVPALDALRDRVIPLASFVYEARRLKAELKPDELALWFHPGISSPRPTVITERAREQLRALGGAFRECDEVWLPRIFALEAVEVGALRGVLLRPR